VIVTIKTTSRTSARRSARYASLEGHAGHHAIVSEWTHERIVYVTRTMRPSNDHIERTLAHVVDVPLVGYA